MFAKKKKKIDISAPSNFQHRVHTGFDSDNGKFVGLPKQWTSLVGKSPHRPKPMLDSSAITPVEVEEVVRWEESTNRAGSAVRSNSLRSSIPLARKREPAGQLVTVQEQGNPGPLQNGYQGACQGHPNAQCVHA